MAHEEYIVRSPITKSGEDKLEVIYPAAEGNLPTMIELHPEAADILLRKGVVKRQRRSKKAASASAAKAKSAGKASVPPAPVKDSKAAKGAAKGE